MVDRWRPARAIDEPRPCFVRLRRDRHGGYVPARIWQRMGMLAAEIDGEPVDVERVWTAGDIITESEYMQLISDRARKAPF
jgi:hypothetical protein